MLEKKAKIMAIVLVVIVGIIFVGSGVRSYVAQIEANHNRMIRQQME